MSVKAFKIENLNNDERQMLCFLYEIFFNQLIFVMHQCVYLAWVEGAIKGF